MDALGEADDTVLGDVVRVRRRQQTGHRRRVDDVAVVAVRQHPRHERAHAVDDAHQVDAQRPAPVGQRALPGAEPQGGRRRRDAGVVEQDVHVAEAIEGRHRRAGRRHSVVATSATTASVSTPRALISASAADSAPGSMSASTTCIPSSAKRRAVANPIPLAAPVTTATRPANPCISTPPDRSPGGRYACRGARCCQRRGHIASTFGMISSVNRLRSSRVLSTGTSWNGGHRSGMVSPASWYRLRLSVICAAVPTSRLLPLPCGV